MVDRTPRSGVIWSGSLSARVRPWASDPSRAFLIIMGSHGAGIRMPEPDTLSQWLDTLSDWGYRSVRTNALAPSLSTALGEVGFTPCQDLILLSRDHGDRPRFGIPSDIVPRPLRIARRRTGRASFAAILDLDRVAFGDEWRMDAPSFTDAMGATRRSRLLVSRADDAIEGFALVGATGDTGYLQRIAVHPSRRRTGVATRLVAASIEWAWSRGCTRTVVNTESVNDAALSLYAGMGFVPMEHGLRVMERDLA